MELTKLRYDVIGASILGKGHPIDDMEKIGFDIVWSEAHPIGDCWLVWVNDYDFELPSYIKIIKNNAEIPESSKISIPKFNKVEIMDNVVELVDEYKKSKKEGKIFYMKEDNQ